MAATDMHTTSHERELRKQQEQVRELQVELSVQRERYRELFEDAPVAYLLLARDIHVVDANAAASELLQLPRGQLIGADFSAFVDAPSAERFAAQLRATARGHQRSELLLVLPDGARRDVRFDSLRDPLDPRRYRCALWDVSPLRQAERQVERAQRLEAIGTFASGIAHDFSNLLAAVAAGVDVALGRVDESDLAARSLQRVKRITVQGRAMVRQLLRFASGPESDSMGVYALDRTVRGAEAALCQLLGDGIALHLQLNAPGVLVALDLGGPEEILLNLAANARDAMPGGGALTIETRVVEAPLAFDPRLPARRHALLSVSDTGHGMDPRTQARVFEPFFTTKSAGQGTGLGLAMVYGIVKRAGGEIQLTSALQQGTTFRIYLPLSPEPDPDPDSDEALHAA